MAKILLHGLTACPLEVDLHIHIQPSGNLCFEFRDKRTLERVAIKYVKAETG